MRNDNNYVISIEQMNEAIKHGYNVLVIINGEYYEYKKEDPKNAGIDTKTA